MPPKVSLKPALRQGGRALFFIGALGALAGPELSYWLASRDYQAPIPGLPCAVIVLGTANADGQERRVQSGVEALRAAGCARLVLSGGAPHSRRVEADEMAEIALSLGVDEKQIVREGASRNTWENIGNSLPLVKDYARVYVVSNSLHAQRGLRYLCRRAPERCGLAHAWGYYRFGEAPFYKWKGAWHELGAYVRYR